ncbi:MAG: hypothetical protein LBP58_02560 [Azoarcus sp.]|nr:hypothetical protein [Azoarcus sp.]
MFLRRRSIGLFLACLLLAMQALWLAHHLEHQAVAVDDGDAVCEFCLAMHGMGSALSGAERTLALPSFSERPAGPASAPRGDAEPVQPRQQGPPLIS